MATKTLPPPSKRPRLERFKDFPRLDLQGKDYVTLPAALMFKCGLFSDGDVMLYCRPQVRELWQFMRDDVLGKDFKGYVVGTPGTGKYVCVLSYAISLDRQEWDVVWIHLNRHAPDICVALGLNESWVIDQSKFELPRIGWRKMFICLDGCIANETHEMFGQRIMAYLGADDRLGMCSSIATLWKRNEEDDEGAKIKPYLMYSWTREEYFAAIRDPDFYSTVRDKFDATSMNDESEDDETLSEEDKKTKAVDLKFYYAGGSCRFLFQYTTEKVKHNVYVALESAANKAELFKYCGGAYPPDPISRLYGMQRGGLTGERFPVSLYVASLFEDWQQTCGVRVGSKKKRNLLRSW